MGLSSGGSRKSSRGMLLKRARNFWSRPLTRNHAHIIIANEIETIEQPEELDGNRLFIYPYKQVFKSDFVLKFMID